MNLKEYWKGLDSYEDRLKFAARSRISIGFLRKVVNESRQASPHLCVRIELATKGRVKVEQLRPDLPWAKYFKSVQP